MRHSFFWEEQPNAPPHESHPSSVRENAKQKLLPSHPIHHPTKVTQIPPPQNRDTPNPKIGKCNVKCLVGSRLSLRLNNVEQQSPSLIWIGHGVWCATDLGVWLWWGKGVAVLCCFGGAVWWREWFWWEVAGVKCFLTVSVKINEKDNIESFKKICRLNWNFLKYENQIEYFNII